MNGRAGFHGSSSYPNLQPLSNQVGFYLLPPDQQDKASKVKSMFVWWGEDLNIYLQAKKKSHHRRGRHADRRWASQSQLDAIAEASDESGDLSKAHRNRNSYNSNFGNANSKYNPWNSSPGRLIRDNTANNPAPRGGGGGLIGGPSASGE